MSIHLTHRCPRLSYITLCGFIVKIYLMYIWVAMNLQTKLFSVRFLRGYLFYIKKTKIISSRNLQLQGFLPLVVESPQNLRRGVNIFSAEYKMRFICQQHFTSHTSDVLLRRVSLVEQELLTLTDHLSLRPFCFVCNNVFVLLTFSTHMSSYFAAYYELHV